MNTAISESEEPNRTNRKLLNQFVEYITRAVLALDECLSEESFTPLCVYDFCIKHKIKPSIIEAMMDIHWLKRIEPGTYFQGNQSYKLSNFIQRLFSIDKLIGQMRSGEHFIKYTGLDEAYQKYLDELPKNPDHHARPPRGLTPRWLFDEMRQNDIVAAIGRFSEVGKSIPIAWMEEYNEIIERQSKLKK